MVEKKIENATKIFFNIRNEKNASKAQPIQKNTENII
jgi:hypothetical protein